MNTLDLIKKAIINSFGSENLKISESQNEIDLNQTGIQFFNEKKDVQFHVYHSDINKLEMLGFCKKSQSTLLYSVGEAYCNLAMDHEGESFLGLPTHIVAISNARNYELRMKNDGFKDVIVYTFSKVQMEEISDEVDDIFSPPLDETDQEFTENHGYFPSNRNN